MKKTLAFIVLVVWLLNCAPTLPQYKYHQYKGIYPIVISKRVGETIDAEEREYFNLFLPEIYLRPTTYRYESATLRAIDGGGYELRISVTTGTLVVVNKDPEGIEILTDYIDNYEEIKESKEMFAEKWGIVDYDFLSLPITNDEIQITKERMVAVKKSPSSRVQPVMIGASLGGCVGGIVAYLITADWETEYHPLDPGAEGCMGCLEITSIAAVYGAGIAGGFAAGGLAGCLVGKSAQEYHELDFEDSVVLEAIKESRKPRVVE